MEELDELLIALNSDEGLSADQRARLEELVAGDDTTRETYLDYMAVDGMLRFRAEPEGECGWAEEEQPKGWPRTIAMVGAAAACLLFAVSFWNQFSGQKEEPVVADVEEVPPAPAAVIFEVAGWNLRASGDAEVELGEAGRVKLSKGEIYAAPGEGDVSPIEIETGAGVVAASGESRFHVQTNAMNANPITRLFVIAGAVATLTNPGGSAEAAPGEIATAEGDTSPKKLLQDGNYREAYAIYEKLVLYTEHGGADCAADLSAAWTCLNNLGQMEKLDALLEGVVEAHPDDWQVLTEVARRYWDAPKGGVIIDNQFIRGGTGGQPVNVAERNRVRALQLLVKAMPHLPEDAEAVGHHRLLAEVVRGGRQLWNLQTLTDIENMPDLGDPVYWASNGAPPVDENDTPIYYAEPESWEAATNDGERWRWTLARRAELFPSLANGLALDYADFLHAQFGMHTAADYGLGVIEEGKVLPEGIYTAHTLNDTETIARLATGRKRFELPDGQRFIQMYRDVADQRTPEPENPLRDLTYKVYHGNWERMPDFTALETVAEGEVASGLLDLGVSGSRTVRFGVVFEGEIEIPKTGEYTFALRSDDGSILRIGGKLGADADGLHSLQDVVRKKVTLEKGRHPLRLDYFQKSSERGLVVTVRGPGMGPNGCHLSTMRYNRTSQERALDRLTQIYENRRQLDRAADVWRELIERFGPGVDFSRHGKLQQIVGNWVRFQTAPVFTAGEEAVLGLQFRNATRAKFKAQTVDIEKYIAASKAYLRSDPRKVNNSRFFLSEIGSRIAEYGEDFLTGESVEWERDLQPPPKHWDGHAAVETPLSKAGLYLVEATANEGNTTRVLCWITDTSIVEKHGDLQNLYYVADATTGAPVAGANVEVFAYWTRKDKHEGRDRTKTLNFSRKTDDEGWTTTVRNDFPNNYYSHIVIARDEKTGRFGILGDFGGVGFAVLKDTPYVAAKAWCVTDRPVYRPGQGVHLKAWVRQARYDLDEVSLYGGREFDVVIRDPAGKELHRDTMTTDALGGVDFDWHLGDEAMLGSYSFFVVAKNWKSPWSDKVIQAHNLGGIQFRVEEYKKPEYEVTVDAPREPTVLGETIDATVRADYYFGAPVTNAQVKYTVKRTPHGGGWYPSRPWDWFYGQGYWHWGYLYDWYPGWGRWCMRSFGWAPPNPPEIVMENTVPIGEDGTVKIKIDTASAKEQWGDTGHRYEITAEVVDESRRTITGTGSVIAAAQPFKVYVWMDGGHYRPGAQMGASIHAQTPDGKGVQGKGKATLYRITFADDGTPGEEAVGEWEIETGEDGNASLAMEAGKAGQYRLSYVLADAKGREQEGAALTRVVGDDTGREDDGFRFDALELVLDKAEYAPGDNARLLINTDRADSTVALFIRAANGVYPKPLMLQLDGKSTVVPIPIAQKDMPNIHVEAFTVSAGKIFTAAREIIVPPEKRMLTLEVTPSEERYEPGEKAKVKLRLTDPEGKPFTGSTVVAIYDKSLEAIAGSQVADLRAHYWKWRRHHRQSHRFSMRRSYSYFSVTGDGGAMAAIGTYHFGPRWGQGQGHGRARGGWRWRYEDFGVDRGLGASFGDSMLFGSRSNYYFGSGVTSLQSGLEGFDSSRDFSQPKGMNVRFRTVNFGEVLRDGVAADGEGGAPVAVRSKFADTALWLADIATDANGEAEVELDMPENLTTWKIKAWAMGHGTRVGHGEAEVITSKDVMIRLQAPRFFTETDEVTLSANVHNYTANKAEFEVTMELEGGQLGLLGDATATQTIEVDAQGDQRVDWKVRALTEGEALVRVKATTASGKGDAMEQRYPVFVHGILKTESFSLAMRDGDASKIVEITVPEERRPEQTHLEVRYSPSIALALVDALPHLAHEPRKNSESSMSRFGPLVITQKILNDLGVDLEAVRDKQINLNPQEIGDAKARAAQWTERHGDNPVFDNGRVAALIERSLRDLTGMQNRDGGWGWYKGHDSTAHNTAYVVHGLQIAEANGAALVPRIFNNGLVWLEKHQKEEVAKLQRGEKNPRIRPWKSNASNTDAFVFMVLADADKQGEELKEMARFIYRDRLGLSPYCQAMAALAFDKLGDDEKRDMIARNLTQYLSTDDENQTARLVLRNRGWRWYWYGNDIEANAYYLKLLCRTGKAKEPTASGIAKYLLNNRKHATYWNSTRDTAVAIEALAEYARASGETEPDLEVEVLVDGTSHKKVKITKDNLFAFDGVLHLRGDALASGKHTVEIKRTGTGNLYANAYLTNFTKEDFITKAGLEIKVERRYYKLEDVDHELTAAGSRGQVTGYKVEKKKRIPLKTGDTVASGDLIEVELLLESKNDYEYLQFSDRKPAGFEVIGSQSGHRWLGGVSAYMELRDERVDFMVQRLTTGQHSLTYRVRAEVPGKFSALPARGDGVYAPELRANSDEFKVSVGER